MRDGHLTAISNVKHPIHLVEDCTPTFQMPNQMWYKRTNLGSEEVPRQLFAGMIESLSSERASPVVLAPKKNGTFRFCIDFCHFNEINSGGTYPILQMDNC